MNATLRWRVLFYFCFFCLGNWTLSIADAPYLISTSFHESVDSQELVSGTRILGASFSHKADKINPHLLYLYLPRRISKFNSSILKIRVVTSDARYKASADYKLSGAKEGWVNVQYPSKYKKLLRSYEINELAVSASIEGYNGFLLSRWGIREKTDHVNIFINSERSDTLYIIRDKSGKPVKNYCSKVIKSTKIKFDTVCTIPSTYFLRTNGRLTLFRENENSRLGKISTQIFFK